MPGASGLGMEHKWRSSRWGLNSSFPLDFQICRKGRRERGASKWDLKMPGRRHILNGGEVGKGFPHLALLCLPGPVSGHRFNLSSWWQMRKRSGGVKRLSPGHTASPSRATLGPPLPHSKLNLELSPRADLRPRGASLDLTTSPPGSHFCSDS